MLVLSGVAAYLLGVFLGVRRLATKRLGPFQSFERKVILYALAIGGAGATIVLGKTLPDNYLGVVFVVFLTLMASFFAVMTAD